MPKFRNTIFVKRPIEDLFDLITTAKYWNIWYSDCKEVLGDIEQPIRINQVAKERIEMHGRKGYISWTCVERKRPYHLVLKGEGVGGRGTLEYSFVKCPGGAKFTRVFQYSLNSPFLKPLELLLTPILRWKQASAIKKIKTMVLTKLPEE